MKSETLKTDSKTENYKEKVMAVLVNAPTTALSRKEFLWAASNLPDTKENGNFDIKTSIKEVDHSCNQVYQCFDITEKDMENYSKVIKDALMFLDDQPKELQQNSRVIEHIINDERADKKFFISMLIKVMHDIVNETSSKFSSLRKASSNPMTDMSDKLEQLRTLIELFAKLKKGNDEEKN